MWRGRFLGELPCGSDPEPATSPANDCWFGAGDDFTTAPVGTGSFAFWGKPNACGAVPFDWVTKFVLAARVWAATDASIMSHTLDRFNAINRLLHVVFIGFGRFLSAGNNKF